MAKKKTEGGRGKKKCPACGTHVGVRTQACKCGHEFQSKPGAKSSDIVGAVNAAQDLIKKCGGAKQAIELIKSLSK